MSPDVDKRVVGRKKLCIPLTRASLVSQNKIKRYIIIIIIII